MSIWGSNGCQSGVRSVYATTDLLDAGLKHVYNMGGGYLAWVQNGLPVTVESGDKKSGPLGPTVALPVSHKSSVDDWMLNDLSPKS
ncbi:thiosulfate sulfurtransferase 18-like protein [Tanacetum coccineum]